VDIKERDRSQ